MDNKSSIQVGRKSVFIEGYEYFDECECCGVWCEKEITVTIKNNENVSIFEKSFKYNDHLDRSHNNWSGRLSDLYPMICLILLNVNNIEIKPYFINETPTWSSSVSDNGLSPVGVNELACFLNLRKYPFTQGAEDEEYWQLSVADLGVDIDAEDERSDIFVGYKREVHTYHSRESGTSQTTTDYLDTAIEFKLFLKDGTSHTVTGGDYSDYFVKLANFLADVHTSIS